MFRFETSRTHGWARIARPHTGVPEIGRSMRAQPCCDHGGALPVVSFKCENETTSNALLFVRAMWRMRTDRFLVPQYEGGLHTPHRQYASQTTSRLIKLKNSRQGRAQ
jgi:hypothetical protein